MLTRALIVLLLVLNLGVALWWVLHVPPQPAPVDAFPADVVRLQLLTEAETEAEADIDTQDVVEPEVETPEAGKPETGKIEASRIEAERLETTRVEQCVSFGPFRDAAAAGSAAKSLQAQVAHVNTRSRQVGNPSSWRVMLPSLGSAAEADAAAKRIAATGFSDYYVIREGDDANAIALGLFRNETSAHERADVLLASGFAAVVKPVDAARTEYWLDIVADGAFDIRQARRRVQATRSETADCATVKASRAP